MGTTQALRVSASKSIWGRASTLQMGCTMSLDDGVGTQSPTRSTPISETWTAVDICFPSYYQVPIDVTARWAPSLVNTSSYLYSWVDWSSVSKLSCSRKEQQHQSGYHRASNPQPFD